MIRCVNIDWLEVFLLEPIDRYPLDASFFEADGWSVVSREYGTRVYKQMFTLYGTDGQPLFEIRREPYSSSDGNLRGLFDFNACHLRLCNRTCYMQHPVDLLRQFITRYGYTLKKIYRLDVCLDFERFDYGDLPASFVERFMRGRYSKINQSNISAHGTDLWDGRLWNSLSWGSRKSMVTTKLYNKTMEIEQRHDKPYIRQRWCECGLIDDYNRMLKRDAQGQWYKPQIWRVEFSIMAGSARWYVIEDHNGNKPRKRPMPHTLDLYDSDERLMLVFFSLAKHYFHFKKYRDGVRKDRCEDKPLFNFADSDYILKLDALATATHKDHSLEVLKRRLEAWDQTHFTKETHEAVRILVDYLERTAVARTLVDPYDYTLAQLARYVLFCKTREQGDKPVAQLVEEFYQDRKMWLDLYEKTAVQ